MVFFVGFYRLTVLLNGGSAWRSGGGFEFGLMVCYGRGSCRCGGRLVCILRVFVRLSHLCSTLFHPGLLDVSRRPFLLGSLYSSYLSASMVLLNTDRTT